MEPQALGTLQGDVMRHCDACNKTISGQLNWLQHVEGRLHKNALAIVELRKSIEATPQDASNTLQDVEPLTAAHPQVKSPALVGATPAVSSLAWCDTCCCSVPGIMGDVNWHAHVAGKPHKNAEARVAMSVRLAPLNNNEVLVTSTTPANMAGIPQKQVMCPVCSCSISGPENWALHITGKQHTKSLARLRQVGDAEGVARVEQQIADVGRCYEDGSFNMLPEPAMAASTVGQVRAVPPEPKVVAPQPSQQSRGQSPTIISEPDAASDDLAAAVIAQRQVDPRLFLDIASFDGKREMFRLLQYTLTPENVEGGMSKFYWMRHGGAEESPLTPLTSVVEHVERYLPDVVCFQGVQPTKPLNKAMKSAAAGAMKYRSLSEPCGEGVSVSCTVTSFSSAKFNHVSTKVVELPLEVERRALTEFGYAASAQFSFAQVCKADRGQSVMFVILEAVDASRRRIIVANCHLPSHPDLEPYRAAAVREIMRIGVALMREHGTSHFFVGANLGCTPASRAYRHATELTTSIVSRWIPRLSEPRKRTYQRIFIPLFELHQCHTLVAVLIRKGSPLGRRTSGDDQVVWFLSTWDPNHDDLMLVSSSSARTSAGDSSCVVGELSEPLSSYSRIELRDPYRFENTPTREFVLHVSEELAGNGVDAAADVAFECRSYGMDSAGPNSSNSFLSTRSFPGVPDDASRGSISGCVVLPHIKSLLGTGLIRSAFAPYKAACDIPQIGLARELTAQLLAMQGANSVHVASSAPHLRRQRCLQTVAEWWSSHTDSPLSLSTAAEPFFTTFSPVVPSSASDSGSITDDADGFQLKVTSYVLYCASGAVPRALSVLPSLEDVSPGMPNPHSAPSSHLPLCATFILL